MNALNSYRGKTGTVACLALSLILFVLWAKAGCFAAEPSFTHTQIYQAASPVYGMDWGDFDPCHTAGEAACMTGDGKVLELSPNPSGWNVSELVWSGITPSRMTSRPTIDIGDVYSDSPGNEIVVQGDSYDGDSHIVMVYHDSNSGWTSGILYDSNNLVGGAWGARVGDFDSRYNGDEIFRIYEPVLDVSNGYSLRPLYPDYPTWHCEQEQIYDAEVGMDSGIGDFDLSHTGREIVVLTEMGPAYELSGSQVGKIWVWTQSLLWSDYTNAGWTAEIADITTDGQPEIVYGTRYNNRIMMASYDNVLEQWNPEAIFTGDDTSNPRNMWDIAVGNILGSTNKLEIAGVDGTGSVYLVDHNGVSWQGRTIWQDTNELYAVVVGDFLTDWGNDEIIVAGETGKITMLSFEFKGDFTNDGKVDHNDLTEITDAWLQSDPAVDVIPWPYGDNTVNFLELAAVASNWLKEI